MNETNKNTIGFDKPLLSIKSRLITISTILVLLLVPIFFPPREDVLSVLSMALLYGSLACAWNLHALSGLISLGHAAFFGIGAYTAVLSTYYFRINPWFSLLIGGFASAVYGAIWFLTFFRLRHGAYTLATFAAAEVIKVIVDNWDSVTFGSAGIGNIPPLFNTGLQSRWQSGFYLIFAVLAVFSLIIHWSALNTNWGLALKTTRESEKVASSVGVPVNFVRLTALLISSFMTGICGVLYSHQIGYIEPNMVFGLHISAMPIVFAYLGGRFFSLGPLLGGLILYFFDQFAMLPLFPSAHQAVYGLTIVIVLWLSPEGILSCFQKREKSV